MGLATWWKRDPLPPLTLFEELQIALSTDQKLIAELAHLDESEATQRFASNNQLYLVSIDNEPVAYGWVASKQCYTGEINLSFLLPPGEEYLWDFATLEGWRGKGIYPHLLQAIIKERMQTTERFWIMYIPDNHASKHGIQKAGFEITSDLIIENNQVIGIKALGKQERVEAAAHLLHLPILA